MIGFGAPRFTGERSRCVSPRIPAAALVLTASDTTSIEATWSGCSVTTDAFLATSLTRTCAVDKTVTRLETRSTCCPVVSGRTLS